VASVIRQANENSLTPWRKGFFEIKNNEKKSFNENKMQVDNYK